MRFPVKTHPVEFVQFAERIFGLSATDTDDLDLVMKVNSFLDHRNPEIVKWPGEMKFAI